MSEEHKNCEYRFKGGSCEDCPLNCKFKRLEQENKKLIDNKFYKYKQALEEIRNKLKKYDANIGDTIIANPIQDCYDTYKLIDEVLDDK